MGQNLCLGHQQLTVDGTAGGVTFTIPKGSTSAFVQVITNPIYMTQDGTTPSSTNGSAWAVGTTFTINTPLASVKMIRQSGTGAVNITYFRDAP